MYINYFALSIFLILIAFALLIRFLFSKRYGQPLANKFVAGIFGGSLLIAFVFFKVVSWDIGDQAFPATKWQQHMKLQQSIEQLEYRPGLGLYAIHGTNEVRVTAENPFCVSNGQLASLEPREIQIADSELSELSPPPQTPILQIDFILLYPIAADEIGFSSFAVFENGEILCTERYMRGGLGGGVAVGFLIFIYMVVSALVFAGSLILLLVISVVSLEIRRQRKDGNSA
ncbi:hypothetical protein ANAEL_02639 [Anaerolineales bacterium]|nr:hypothetical protein ANAEL_02639 [Anaerolineales bacterium]